MPGGSIIARPQGFMVLAPGAGNNRASEGSSMRIDPNEGSPAMDYPEHTKTYKLFCKLTAFAILTVVTVMVLLAVFVV